MVMLSFSLNIVTRTSFEWLQSVFGCHEHVGKFFVCPDAAWRRSAATLSLERVSIIGASQSSRSRLNTASRTAFRIASIGVPMGDARWQACGSSGLSRFDQPLFDIVSGVLAFREFLPKSAGSSAIGSSLIPFGNLPIARHYGVRLVTSPH